MYVHDEDTIVFFFFYVCGKVGHMTSRFKDLPKKDASNAFRTNKKGPTNIWVPKDKIILVADVHDSKKDTPIVVPRQWFLTTHEKRKVYVLMSLPMHGGTVTFKGNKKGIITTMGKISVPLYPPIDNVSFVEGLKHNLLSISQL